MKEIDDSHIPKLDILIPVYNEGLNISRTLELIYRDVPLSKRIIIIFDFEEDDTLPVVRDLAALYPDVILVRNNLGPGVVNAVRAGIAATLAEVVVVTMADLSDDVSIVPRMVTLIRDQGFDIVCASRYMSGGHQIGGPWLKKSLSRAAGLSLYWLAGFPTHDATNAFRAYRRNILTEFPIESRGGFAYSLEITSKAHAAGRRITEIPSTWHDRSSGKSRFRLRAWLPHYLSWYIFALTHRIRVDRDKAALREAQSRTTAVTGTSGHSSPHE